MKQNMGFVSLCFMRQLDVPMITVILLSSTLVGCFGPEALEETVNDDLNDIDDNGTNNWADDGDDSGMGNVTDDGDDSGMGNVTEDGDDGGMGNVTEDGGCARPSQRGVALTFDDRKNIQSWGENRGFLDSRGVKATFFIEDWEGIEDWEIDVLENLSSDGHEIGFHSTSQGDYYKFLEQNLSAEDYLEIEILPGLESMNQHGFFPTSFAYPLGHRDADLDQLILRHFSVLRGTRNNAEGSESWMVRCEDLRVFRAFPLIVEGESQERLEDKEYWTEFSLDEVEDNPITIIFNGHGIKDGGYPTSLESLSILLDEIDRLELEYLLMSDLGE